MECGSIFSLSIHTNGELFASGSYDSIVRIHSINNEKIIK